MKKKIVKQEKEYRKVYDKRKKLYGIKKRGERTWYIEPTFQNLDSNYIGECEKEEVWFRPSMAIL